MPTRRAVGTDVLQKEGLEKSHGTRPLVASLASIAMADLDDAERVSAHKARQAHPVRAGPLDAECFVGAGRMSGGRYRGGKRAQEMGVHGFLA
jgi:hypothetical protein